MATFKISGVLNVVFEDVEIEAKTKEEALAKLYKMDAVDILDEGYIKESDITDEEVELDNAKFTFKVNNIDYDIDEDDLDDIDEDDIRSNGPEYYIRKIKEGLPKELFLTVEYGYSKYLHDFEDTVDLKGALAQAISYETGYCINDFNYYVNPDQEELFNEFIK